MEERLFEKFLELIEKRDEEIGYILGYSSFEYFYRRRMLFRISRGLPVDEGDNEIQELLRKRHANRILDRLQNKMRSGASKSAIEDYIKKRTPVSRCENSPSFRNPLFSRLLSPVSSIMCKFHYDLDVYCVRKHIKVHLQRFLRTTVIPS